MEYIQLIIEKLMENFDFPYMLTVVVLTYILVKIWDRINGDNPVKSIYKKLTLLFSIVFIGGIYILLNYENKIALLNSAILAPIFWNYVIKPIFKLLKIDYKSIDKYMN